MNILRHNNISYWHPPTYICHVCVMIYETPELSAADHRVLDAIGELRSEMRFFLHEPRRWYGTLRRSTIARAVQGSNSIEGYNASVEDVAAMIDGEDPQDADQETRHAIASYRDAMTYVLQLARSKTMEIDESLLKALHFMMLKYDLAKHPGQWRPGAIWVEDARGEVVYEAPARDSIEPLVAETLQLINAREGPAMVRAAMAHLNLVLIHPFSDGNGRMARCIQSFALAADGAVSPEFLSIEEYLGRNTPAYYDVLARVAEGSWSPARSPAPWLRFCLTAHYRQAHTVLRRIRETEAVWDACDRLVRERGVPERSISALCDVARGWRLQRSLYVKIVYLGNQETISDETATRDLRALSAAGLLQPIGEKRGRSYEATQDLREVWQRIRAQRRASAEEDPYAL